MQQSIQTLIETQLQLRPQMEIQDVYKLLYQSVMGLGHLLTNHQAAEGFLIRELHTVGDPLPQEELFEDISLDTHMVRINLRPFKQQNGCPEKLFHAMLKTEQAHTKSIWDFIKIWRELMSLVHGNKLPFDGQKLMEFTEEMIAKDYPVTHHSGTYRELYSPAYRIISGRFLGGLDI